ncbi:MAG: R3H domain-containing nucleic acid-binding protein [bacterium]
MQRNKGIFNVNVNSDKNNSKSKKNIDEIINTIKNELTDSIHPYVLNDLNPHQIQQIKKKLLIDKEYKIKTYKQGRDIKVKIFPLGNLKRFAEQKAQEVLMKGEKIKLPHMGAFERFIIHDYLKSRNGIKTKSFGKEGKDRSIQIYPLFGRKPKKAKKKLTI